MALTQHRALIVPNSERSRELRMPHARPLHRKFATHAHRTACFVLSDEDRDAVAGGKDSDLAVGRLLINPLDFQCDSYGAVNGNHLKQDEIQRSWFWIPALSTFSFKEELVILPANVSSKCFTWEGWGTSLCWWANFAGGLQSSDRDCILDLLFDLDKGLGMNIARYNIGGDSRQRTILLGARDRGATVFEAFSNSPPHWMTLSGSVTGNTRWGQDNLDPAYDVAFVDYLTEVVKHYQDQWNLHFESIAPFNEPVEGWWNINKEKTTAQEGCNFSISSMRRLIPKLKDALAHKKLQTKISAFDSWSQNTTRILLGMDEDVLAAIDRINVHTYVFHKSLENWAKRRQVREASESVGKKIWMSEYGPLNWHGEDIDVALGLGRHISLDLNELQASAWCYWQALEMPGSFWGLIQTSFTYDVEPKSLIITKQYYVLMQFTKWIRPGCHIFPVENFADSFLASADPAAKQVVLVFINASTTFKHFGFDVSLLAPWFKTDDKLEATLFRTSALENHERLPSLIFTFPSIMILVNSKSITTMVLSKLIS
ncbi:hypothetical protein KP509_23G054100 [Ceratopteris richardii]|uniref:Endo-beta-1,6-galactanase-like domain-containing protein n=1 Tax=Ceratopteris richardii TaxID=49495 RepID=A0A8T2RZX7_CERRI|nr:hypothetical protein KP509_23G054100 [Ceratopteris richardii]